MIWLWSKALLCPWHSQRKKTIILQSRFYQSLDGPGLIPGDCQTLDDIITSITLVITLTWVVLPKPARPVRQQHIGWDYISQRCVILVEHTQAYGNHVKRTHRQTIKHPRAAYHPTETWPFSRLVMLQFFTSWQHKFVNNVPSDTHSLTRPGHNPGEDNPSLLWLAGNLGETATPLVPIAHAECSGASYWCRVYIIRDGTIR